MSWDEEKNIYVEKLERIITGINKIIDLKGNRIVTSEMISSLRQLRSDAELLLPKLKKGEFEIAVVGLEKAGKSSFCNALIGRTPLPTAPERCTYTSTCIRPGGETVAEVTFYSRPEFDRSFQEKLETLGIPDARAYTIENMGLDRYKQLFADCDAKNRKLYQNTLHRDVIDILGNQQKLREYIGHPKQKFSGDELETDDFKSFITKPDKAIAVKEVVIYSTELRGMPNAVMYDVPGFNSPTAMHEEQTLERMQAADAIVMVAKANEPSLDSAVLNIFQKSDIDGSYLSEKLFVFANKADLVANVADLEKNRETTYKEWTQKYAILPDSAESQERIVFGSANPCLADIETPKKLEEKGIGRDGNISILRDKLQIYYKTTRFEVLKKRVNKILVDVKKMFDGTGVTSAAPYDNAEKYEIAMALRRELAGSIRRQLEDLKYRLNNEAVKDRPLTTHVSDHIRDIVTVERYTIQHDELERIHKEKIGIELAEQPQAIDIAISSPVPWGTF